MSGNDERCVDNPSASRLDILLRHRTTALGIQFFRYILVGGSAAVVDVTLVYLLAHHAELHYLVAVAFAFSLGSAVNYIGCVLWIFQPGAHRKREISAFVVVGAVGLILNEVTVWLLHGRAGVALMPAKIAAVALGLFWNFTLRKRLVFREPLFGISARMFNGKAPDGE